MGDGAAPQESALGLIRGTFADLDAWRARSGQVNVPDVGSELAGDDLEVISWHTSQLALAGLGGARNHLQAVRVHIDARQGFPDATGTLIRGAMLSAAQTVWLLAPDDRPIRLKRTRLLVREVLQNHRKALADLLRISPDHETTQQVHQHVVRRLDEVQQRRDERDERAEFSNTTLIEQAAIATFGEGIGVEARAEWRRMSGNAHGLPWAMLGMSGTVQASESDPAGFAAFTTGGAFDDFVNPYFLAYRMLEHGWRLYDKRATHDAGGAPH